MSELQEFLNASAARHNAHLCPRQVLGVRIGLYAGEWLRVPLSQTDKRIFCFVETDGCLTDGIAVATGCAVGRRAMVVMDYGKSAATFVDTLTGKAVRIAPRLTARIRALDYAPDAPDRWHAQLQANQVMPATELLDARAVMLTVSLQDILSQHGKRVMCEQCGEDIINQREVRHAGRVLCRACAGEAYYQIRDGAALYSSNSANAFAIA